MLESLEQEAQIQVEVNIERRDGRQRKGRTTCKWNVQGRRCEWFVHNARSMGIRWTWKKTKSEKMTAQILDMCVRRLSPEQELDSKSISWR